MPLNYQCIGQRVKEYRIRQHLRQEDLAGDVDFSVSYLSCIETGKKKPSLNIIVRIAEALDVTVECLLFGDIAFEDDELHELKAVLNGCSENAQKVIKDAVLGTAEALKKSLRINGLV